MKQVFDVLSSIGAAAYCTPVGLDEIARMHPNRAEECKNFSAGITADLMRALSDQLIDPFTIRDYLRMLCELREYRAMFLYITNPSAIVKLNWKQVARRVGELIDHGWFLTADEMDRYMQNHLEEPISIEGEPPRSEESIEEPVQAIYEAVPRETPSTPTERAWVNDMLEQHRNDLLGRVTESPDYPKALGSPDEGNFRMEVDSIIEGIAAGLATEDIDLYRVYYDYPEFREGLHEYRGAITTPCSSERMRREHRATR